MNHSLTALLLVAAAVCLGWYGIVGFAANDTSAELAVGGLTFTKNAGYIDRVRTADDRARRDHRRATLFLTAAPNR